MGRNIRIVRKGTWLNNNKPFFVFIDDEQITEVYGDSSVTIEIDRWSHTLCVRANSCDFSIGGSGRGVIDGETVRIPTDDFQHDYFVELAAAGAFGGTYIKIREF